MSKTLTPAERARVALNLCQPDQIPTFELEFQLSEEFFGYPLSDPRLEGYERNKRSPAELEKAACDLADKYARVYGTSTTYDIGGAAISGDPEKDSQPGLDYSIIPVYCHEWWNPISPITVAFRKRLREHFGDTRLFGDHGDGTFAIPDGNDMYAFAYRIADDPDSVLEKAERMASNALESNKRQHEAGLDVALLCSDYCYNSGSFLSPAMFDEYITPFLEKICKAGRDDGMLVIKHTDATSCQSSTPSWKPDQTCFTPSTQWQVWTSVRSSVSTGTELRSAETFTARHCRRVRTRKSEPARNTA